MHETWKITAYISEPEKETDKTTWSDYTPNFNANALSIQEVQKSEEIQDVLTQLWILVQHDNSREKI